jgi:hypothetical protein
MVWREQRTVTAALTLHYNKAVFILEPNEVARKLVRKRVTVCEYPDGRLEIQHEGHVAQQGPGCALWVGSAQTLLPVSVTFLYGLAE